MIKSIFLFSTLLSSVFSSTITLSKDSIKVYNDLHSSFKDELTITNNSKDTISLDSAYLLFYVFDTSGMSKYLTNYGTDRKFETYWIDFMHKMAIVQKEANEKRMIDSIESPLIEIQKLLSSIIISSKTKVNV